MGTNGREKPSRGIGSVETGGAILKALSDHGTAVKLSELALLTGLSAGRLHPYLVSLRNTGLVEQTAEGSYQLGPFALEIGLVRLRHLNPVREAIPRIAALSQSLGLTVSVAVFAPQGPTIVYIQEHTDILHFNIRVGGVYYMTMTATGILFSALLPPSMTSELIEAEFASREVGGRRDWFRVDRETFARETAEARARGYAVTRDMPVPGITAVSAPVHDYTGRVQLCIAAIGPGPLVDAGPDGRVVQTLLAFTDRLSGDLGHSGEA
ncbi:IclR family transcriptional regulator [Pseudooceanicola aestuarii]|uniref:IclR family transcriptional regulator n=1 Tax=Pseudooceanicola aestuarii TaxID=2697319 RepID=UPI0013D3B7F1|nr:IclR family transcriptional regulator [Pseudooceanicola aestuarii]